MISDVGINEEAGIIAGLIFLRGIRTTVSLLPPC